MPIFRPHIALTVSLCLTGCLSAFVLPARADVLEFGKGQVVTHAAADYRAKAAAAQALADAQAPLAQPASLPGTLTVTLFTPVPADLQPLVDAAARLHGVDGALIGAVMAIESNYVVDAVSHKGAMGLMQLMPETAEMLGVADAFDPAQNIDGGTRYIKRLLGRYNGDRSLALAAYNAGTRAVDSYGGVPPYAETRDYLLRLNERLGPPPGGGFGGSLPNTDPFGTGEAVPAAPDNPLAPRASKPLIVFGAKRPVSGGFYRAGDVVASAAENEAENENAGDDDGQAPLEPDAVETTPAPSADAPEGENTRKVQTVDGTDGAPDPASASDSGSAPGNDIGGANESVTGSDAAMELVWTAPDLPDAAITRLPE